MAYPSNGAMLVANDGSFTVGGGSATIVSPVGRNDEIAGVAVTLCDQDQITLLQIAAGVGGGLTDAQLRASPVSVSTGLVQALTDAQLRASPVPVSGPLTDAQLRALAVPISAAALPLPASASTDRTTAAAPFAVRLSDGSNFYSAGASARFPVSFFRSGNDGITTAAVLKLMQRYTPPSTRAFVPLFARAGVTTAGSRTVIAAGRRLGTFNTGTNVFTADQTATAPNYYDRLYAIVSTVMSASTDVVTATYTNEAGTGGHTTSGLTIAATPVDSVFEFVLAAGDIGVTAVTACSDTTAATGVIEIWGLSILLESLGAALAGETATYGSQIAVNDTDTMMILYHAAATTAQQRYGGVTGYLL